MIGNAESGGVNAAIGVNCGERLSEIDSGSGAAACAVYTLALGAAARLAIALSGAGTLGAARSVAISKGIGAAMQSAKGVSDKRGAIFETPSSRDSEQTALGVDLGACEGGGV